LFPLFGTGSFRDIPKAADKGNISPKHHCCMDLSTILGGRNKVLTIAVVAVVAVTAMTVAVYVSPSDEPTGEELLMDALVYTYPMVLVEKTMETQSNTVTPNYDTGKAPINRFVHTQRLSNAEFKDFTMPNVDTIYSFLNYDVREEPFVLTIPDPERFMNTQLLNAWIDVYGVYGDAGKECTEIVICSMDCNIEFDDDLEVARSVTDRGIVAIRTMVFDESDMENVIDIQKQMDFIPWSYYISGESYTPPDGKFDPALEFIPHNAVEKMSMQDYFDLANERMLVNHPYNADAKILKRLLKIGVGPGLQFDESIFGEGSEELWNDTMKRLYYHTFPYAANFTIIDYTWQYRWDPIADFGTEYEYRAFVAYTGYVANPTSVALYVTTKMDSDFTPITGSSSYNIHFEAGRFPPVRDNGFWSITVYGPDYFLIDNAIDRYSVNDRMDLRENEDGSVDILLSSTQPDDITNWLPINGDGILLTIRLYIPDLDAIDSGWKCPVIIPI
jgi:Uncharacterized conserved protein